MSLWKRNAVVAAIVLFVCAAVYLNWTYQQEEAAQTGGKALGQAALVSGTADPLLALPSPTPEPQETASPASPAPATGYFASARLNRQQARDGALAILRETVSDETAQESARVEAGEAMEAMAATTMSEAQIENLVIAKGYQDCVAFISTGGVSVVVSATEEGLQSTDVARITEIVTGETGVPASQVKIIEAQG